MNAVNIRVKQKFLEFLYGSEQQLYDVVRINRPAIKVNIRLHRARLPFGEIKTNQVQSLANACDLKSTVVIALY